MYLRRKVFEMMMMMMKEGAWEHPRDFVAVVGWMPVQSWSYFEIVDSTRNSWAAGAA
jgi:hypothetical protein